MQQLFERSSPRSPWPQGQTYLRPIQVFDCLFCPTENALREKENPAPKKQDQPSFEIAQPENADSLALAAILELLYVCSGLHIA